MCAMCRGATAEDVRRAHVQQIEHHGWSMVGVMADRDAAAMTYTVGLTRYHDHPELIATGLEYEDASDLLEPLAESVRSGVRLAAGDVLSHSGAHRLLLVRVNDPSRLMMAQEIYGGPGAVVPALQVAYSDHDGRWPWQHSDRRARSRQPMFGRPLVTE